MDISTNMKSKVCKYCRTKKVMFKATVDDMTFYFCSYECYNKYIELIKNKYL